VNKYLQTVASGWIFINIEMFETTTVDLNEICNSCPKIAFCSSELIFTFLHADSDIKNAREQFGSCIHFSYLNFDLHPTTQTRT